MLRVIFMGTAELACASLRALAAAPDIKIVAVVTQPDKPKGRDLKLQPSHVKVTALEHNIPVLQPERARNPEFVQALRDLNPDLIVVAAYGQILPQAILDLPKFGCLNVHTSLLPKYRGAAPIQWAILDGEKETGVTIMKMDAGLDTGDILTRETTPISPTDNSQTLHDKLAEVGARLLLHTISLHVRGEIQPKKQPPEGASYARKISKEDGKLEWSEPAHVLWNRVRGFTPWPGAFVFQQTNGKTRLLKIWQAEVVNGIRGKPGTIIDASKNGIVVACGADALRILVIQPEGSRRMTAQEFLAGNRLNPGDTL